MVFSLSCCKKTIGNALGLISLSLHFTDSVLIEHDLAPLDIPGFCSDATIILRQRSLIKGQF